jgi:hypothetical protein
MKCLPPDFRTQDIGLCEVTGPPFANRHERVAVEPLAVQKRFHGFGCRNRDDGGEIARSETAVETAFCQLRLHCLDCRQSILVDLIKAMLIIRRQQVPEIMSAI